ncbi:MAG: hypothetical protein F4W92_07880 [Gammaproteobacteria bacterium]|nr:hypothetical protein [Gammaproteobacteria bacterium]
MRIGLGTLALLCSITFFSNSHEASVPSLGTPTLDNADEEMLLEPSKLRARIEAGEAEEVLTLATEVISEIEENRTRYDEALVKPLIVFGDASRELGEYIDAIEAYERARQISRLTNGLNSIEQVEAVHREAETYFELGHIGDANDSYEYIFSIYNQQFEPFSVDLLPTIFMLADWYVLIYNVFAARGLYEYATEIVDHHLERTSPENIRALQGLADTYRLERFRPLSALGQIQARIPVLYWADETPFRYFAKVNDFETGEDALVELVKIELERSESTPESVARAKLQLADWFTLFEQNERAVVIYQDILATFEDTETEFFTSEFREAVPLFLPLSTSPDPQPLRLESPPATGEVGFTVDVDETGRVIQVQLDFAQPQGDFVEEFEKSLKNAIYRPRFEDGKPMPRTNVKVHHRYIFFPKAE